SDRHLPTHRTSVARGANSNDHLFGVCLRSSILRRFVALNMTWTHAHGVFASSATLGAMLRAMRKRHAPEPFNPRPHGTWLVVRDSSATGGWGAMVSH